MNSKSVCLLLGLLMALVISSCSPIGPVAHRSPNAGAAEVATTGNRSGNYSQVGNSIDAILNNPPRTGLATGWGDAKKSNIRFVSFERNSSKPAATDRIYYNDKKGIELMTRNPKKVKGLQKTAGGLVEWGIKGNWGYMTTYKDYGMSRRFVVGKEGSNYSIVVKNLSDSPLEIVCSVDGLDVQDGKTAAFKKRGYIVGAEETLEIEGFRTSRMKVAAFEFSSVADSYANLKHGNTRNVGVIGMAVFTPKGMRQWATSPDGELRAAASPFSEKP